MVEALCKGPLQIRPSLIPKAGFGIFSTVFLKKGTVIGKYKGTRLRTDQFERCRKEDYIWEIKYPKKGDHTYIDAYFKKMNNPLRYVNAAYKKRERKKINTLMFQKHKSVWYKLSRSVLPGTELIVDYGDVYFDNEVEQEDKEDLWRFTIIPESKSQKRRRRRKELKKKNK